MAAPDAANWRAIAVKNVPPSLLAWQLDGAHNEMPAFVNVPYMPSLKYAGNYQEPERVAGPFDLPAGVRLAADDENKLLFVTGTDAQQLAQIRNLVSLLDQPLRQVEIEAQLVELPAAQIKQFGMDTARANFDAATADVPAVAAPAPGAIQVGFVRGDFQKRVDELVKAGTVRVISTKPQIITNNASLAVSLLSDPIDNTGANQNKIPVAPAEGSDTVVTLTPTINGDDTITVLMKTEILPKNINASGLTTIANLRDGDTIALTGLQSSAFPGATMNYRVPILGEIPDIGSLFRSKMAVVMFVTARIVRSDAK